MKIMFVCTGNTCRSPMAEAIAKSVFPEDKYEIISRGISVYANAPASTNAQQAVKNAGLDLSEHVSKQISEEDIKTSDVIFTMTNAHKQMLMNVCAKYGKPIFSLAEFVGSTEEISDPYGAGLEVYENCFRQIAGYVNMAAEIIKE